MPPRTASFFFSLFAKDPPVAAESPTHGAFLKSSLLFVSDWLTVSKTVLLEKTRTGSGWSLSGVSFFQPSETHSQTIKPAQRRSETLELSAARWIPHLWHWRRDLLQFHAMWGRLANDSPPLPYYLWPGGTGPWLPGRWINPMVGGPLAQKAGEHHKVS